MFQVSLLTESSVLFGRENETRLSAFEFSNDKMVLSCSYLNQDFTELIFFDWLPVVTITTLSLVSSKILLLIPPISGFEGLVDRKFR